ncbi:MAG: hypothetical protein ACPGVB_11980 [Chitinophagales bacterium]
MFLVFNELSSEPFANTIQEAEERIRLFIQTFNAAKEEGFEYIRAEGLSNIALTKDKKLGVWAFIDPRTSENGVLKEFFWGENTRRPYISDEDEEQEDLFINQYFFVNRDNKEIESQGLAVAYIYNTLAISFLSSDIWEEVEQVLIVKDEKKENKKEVIVYQAAKPEQFEIELLSNWIEELKGIELVTTNLVAEDKKIKLRDDHGKDILKAFSKKIRNSPYVLGILNSMPFNPTNDQFIKKIRDEGIIEIVLYWIDEGLGIVVKTTGRNIRETKAISDILKEKYDKK